MQQFFDIDSRSVALGVTHLVFPGALHSLSVQKLKNYQKQKAMDIDGKSWMSLPRYSEQYINGMDEFLNGAFEQGAKGNEILCPCKKRSNRFWKYRDVREHLIVDGFLRGYTEWVFHEEYQGNEESISKDEGDDFVDDVDGILDDTFRNILEEDNLGIGEGPNAETKKVLELMEVGQQELSPGCKNFSKLNHMIMSLAVTVMKQVFQVKEQEGQELWKMSIHAPLKSKKYDVPTEGKKWVMATMASIWRQYKCRIKTEHYTKYKTDKQRSLNRLESVSEETFKALLKYWNSNNVKKISEKNINNRKQQRDMHTTGKTRFAMVKEKMVKSMKLTTSEVCFEF